MELDYEKDVIKLMKLLSYKLQSIKYQNPQIDDFEKYFNEPWLEITLYEKELLDVRVPLSLAKLLVPAVYEKQGMHVGDFITTITYGDDVPVEEPNYINVHILFWIDNIIKDIENNNKKIENPELYTKILNENNSIIFNGLTGDVTYNSISEKLTLDSRKFKFLRALLRSESNLITYDEMSRLFFKTDYNKANHSKAITDVLDDIKRDLGILPSTEHSNRNCFENITGKGYRLSLP